LPIPQRTFPLTLQSAAIGQVLDCLLDVDDGGRRNRVTKSLGRSGT